MTYAVELIGGRPGKVEYVIPKRRRDMSGCLGKIKWGAILLAAVISVVIGLALGYFWLQNLDISTCMESMVEPDTGNIVSDFIALIMVAFVAALFCAFMGMVAYIPVFIALSVLVCTIIVFWRVKDARLLNIILAVLLSHVVAYIGLAVLSLLTGNA
jgi:hypothetical protein